MSGSDKPDLARGWRSVEGLLAEDELKRLEGLSDVELDAELRAVGLDPDALPADALPTAEELVAEGRRRADARAAAAKKPGPR